MISLSSLLHLVEGRDLSRGQRFVSLNSSSLNLNVRFGALLNNLEGVELDVILNSLVSPVSANQPLGIEHGVLGVAGQLVLGGVSHESLSLSSEGHVAGGDTVTLVIGDDLNTSVLENSNT